MELFLIKSAYISWGYCAKLQVRKSNSTRALGRCIPGIQLFIWLKLGVEFGDCRQKDGLHILQENIHAGSLYNIYRSIPTILSSRVLAPATWLFELNWTPSLLETFKISQKIKTQSKSKEQMNSLQVSATAGKISGRGIRLTDHLSRPRETWNHNTDPKGWDFNMSRGEFGVISGLCKVGNWDWKVLYAVKSLERTRKAIISPSLIRALI